MEYFSFSIAEQRLIYTPPSEKERFNVFLHP